MFSHRYLRYKARFIYSTLDLRVRRVARCTAVALVAAFVWHSATDFMEFGVPQVFDWSGIGWHLKRDDGSWCTLWLPFLAVAFCDPMIFVASVLLLILWAPARRDLRRNATGIRKEWQANDGGIRGLLYVRHLWGRRFTEMIAKPQLSLAAQEVADLQSSPLSHALLVSMRLIPAMAWCRIVVEGLKWWLWPRADENPTRLLKKGWKALFDQNFCNAEQFSLASWRLQCGLPYASENYAHALLFQDRMTEAVAVYRSGFGFIDHWGWDFEAAVLRDFSAFRSVGMCHPAMAVVEQEIRRRRLTESGVPKIPFK